MIKFAVLGAGWRSEFFMRIANTLPDTFEVVGVLMRNKEKGQIFQKKFHVPVFYDFDELIKKDLDFVVVSYPWEVAFEYNKKLFALNVPILSETPIAPTLETVDQIWEESTHYPVKIQVAEQYFAQPYHSALMNIIQNGMIGEPTDVLMSMLHGYHGINMIRRYLGVKFETCTISAKRFYQELRETCSRSGLVYNDHMLRVPRDTATFEFSNGKVAYLDFCDEQYFSQIRSRFLRICGTKGEIFNQTVRYINDHGEYACSEIKRIDLGQYSSHEGYSLRGLMLNDQYIYRNPFEEKTISDQRRLNDEELAITQVLLDMKEYVENGKEFYGLAEACQDTYLSHCLTKALETGQDITTTKKLWCK